jgi:hypothetical protein
MLHHEKLTSLSTADILVRSIPNSRPNIQQKLMSVGSSIFNTSAFPGRVFVAHDVLSYESARMEHIERLTMPPPPTYL